ncbi:hypothetical protein PDJ95_27330 [Bacillus cereus]|nr:hypothetical protein [Bacillus cereus]
MWFRGYSVCNREKIKREKFYFYSKAFSKSYEIPDGFDNIQFSPFNKFNSGGNIQGEIYFGLGQTPRIDTTRLSSKAANLETQSNLEEVSALVRMLFTSDTHDELATDVTDYAIDQILLKIELLSDSLFQQEKHRLLKYIKKAKHLSIQRNLLQHGSFENTEHWILSAHTGVRSNHELFKNTSLELQSTLEPMKYPTYAYQYIPKDKLRSYTRYLVRGFIAESSGLDLLLSCDSVCSKNRLDVRKENVLPISIDQGNCCTLTDCIDVYEKNPNSHWFTYPIHTGSLQYNLDTGLELCFKLETENGVAQIGNIEIIEERALTLKETKSIQRKETKWYKQQKTKDKKTQEKLDEAHQKITSLFNLDSSLRFEVTYQDIQDIQIPSVIALEGIYHSMMPDQPGPYYNDYSQLVALQRHARRLYKNRNLLSSGTFQYDLQHWNIEGAATLKTKNRDCFLHLLDWSAVASQSIRLDAVDKNNKDIRYYLRVHAQGIGRVTLQHGGEIETLSFTTLDKQTRLMEWCPITEQVELEITSDANEFMIYSIEIFKHLLE